MRDATMLIAAVLLLLLVFALLGVMRTLPECGLGLIPQCVESLLDLVR